jgi:hypothetical protein
VIDKIAGYTAMGAERFYLQFLDLGDLDHFRPVGETVQPHLQAR